MTAVEVDVVIAVHTAQRPVARAVISVFAAANPSAAQGGGRVPVRVTVVAHNIDAAVIEANLEGVLVPAGSSLRVLPFVDETRSPAGPFNHGLDAADAPYVAVMGSDDRLAAGALASWVALARRTEAAVVIARLANARPDGSISVVPTPPARPLRTARLDGVKDRLSYRSAPLGLIDRKTMERLGLRFTLGHEVGEDVAFVTRLWFSGEPIAFDRRGPAYLVQDDALDRTTYVARPVSRELAFLADLVAQQWFVSLPLRARRAAATKLLRIHVFGLLINRTPDFWTSQERATLADITRSVVRSAPGCQRVLSRADRAVLDAVTDPAGPVDQTLALARARRLHGRPQTIITRDLRMLMAREAPLRLMAASVMVRW